MVGDGQSGHAQLFGTVNQCRNAAHAIEQAEFGMDVKMSEHAVKPGVIISSPEGMFQQMAVSRQPPALPGSAKSQITNLKQYLILKTRHRDCFAADGRAQ
jgi:hypothetical protein